MARRRRAVYEEVIVKLDDFLGGIILSYVERPRASERT